MRGDELGIPVISTYATGGDVAPARRGGGLALPVIVILGTASVAAIVSVSFEGEMAAVSDQRPAAGDPAPQPHVVAHAVSQAAPGFSSGTDGLPVDADEPRPGSAGDDARQQLPYMAVLQPTEPKPAVRPRAEVRAPRAVPQAGHARHPAVPDSDVTGTPDAALLPAAAPDIPLAELDTGLRDAVVPLVADEQADLAAPTIETQPVAPAAPVAIAVAADPTANEAQLANSRPADLPEPADEVAASATDAAPALVPAEPPAVEIGVTSPEPAGGGEGAVAAAALPEPSVSVHTGPAPSAAASSIPEHIARIGERYAEPPAAAPATPDQAAAAPDSVTAAPAATGGSTVIASLDDAAGSTVIVQDDELVAIRLGELVSLLEHRFDHPLYVWMKSSSAASKFVTAETLAEAGIRTHYDPQRRQIVFSTTDD